MLLMRQCLHPPYLCGAQVPYTASSIHHARCCHGLSCQPLLILCRGDDSRFKDISDAKGEDAEDPFHAIPVLCGFHLSRAKVVLGRTHPY